MKKLIAILLLAATLMLSSCQYFIKNGPHPKDPNYFPEGYTGGFGIEKDDYNTAYYWVETYEECAQAIELLKSHGSTFSKNVIFTYEGDLFDTKYCFMIGRMQSEKIKYGENPFDRWAEYVEIWSFAFYDDVAIDELIYSYTSEYECTMLHTTRYFRNTYIKDPSINSGEFVYEWDGENYMISDLKAEYPILSIGGCDGDPIPESHVEAIINSIEIISSYS